MCSPPSVSDGRTRHICHLSSSGPNGVALGLRSACAPTAAGSLSDCCERRGQTSPFSPLPTDNPSSFHQLAPALAYALYLHEQRLIPDVIAQLSKWISGASSQRAPPSPRLCQCCFKPFHRSRRGKRRRRRSINKVLQQAVRDKFKKKQRTFQASVDGRIWT